MTKADAPLAGILLFDGVEVLDFAGPLECLGQAKQDDGRPCFRAVTLAPASPVTCAGGLRVIPDYDLDGAPELDLLVVPGGPGAREPADGETLAAFLRSRRASTPLLASVCTGAYLLALAGLLDGRTATTHPARLADFAARFPKVRAMRAKLVDQGDIITAGGVASGVDLALYLIEQRYGPQAREKEAGRLDGPWS